jgi:hypothetical protein
MLYRVIQGRGKIQPKPKKYEKEKKRKFNEIFDI